MRFIIDFIDTASEQDIADYLTAAKATVVTTFDNLGKVYVVTTARTPKASEIVDSLIRDDKAPIELLERVDFAAYETDSQAVADEDNWWKLAVVSHVDYDGDDFTIQRVGRGTPVYLLDSGITASHPDFEGRDVVQLHTFADDFADISGHGTALASLIVGNQCGICDASLKVIKVFESGRDTHLSDLIGGLNAAAQDYLTDTSRPGLVNLSWGIPRNQYLDDKIAALRELGLIVVVAAGNSGVAIGDVSPAAIPDVYTVGSFGQELRPSDFSNYTGPSDTSNTAGEQNGGPGLDFFAPGEAIRAAKTDGTLGYTAGTSAAAAIMTACTVINIARLTTSYRLMPRDAVENNIVFWANNNLLTLEGKFANSPNRVPSVKAQPNDGTVRRQVLGNILVPAGRAFTERLIDPTGYDSYSAELPEGFTIEENFLHGDGAVELPESGIRSIPIKLTLHYGDTVEEATATVVYFDEEKFNTQDGDYSQLVAVVEYACSCPNGRICCDCYKTTCSECPCSNCACH